MSTLAQHPLLFLGAVCLLGAAAAGLVYFWLIAPVGAAYKAKVICSALFVSGRELRGILAEDVSVDSYRILRLFTPRVDRGGRSVTVSWLGMRPRTAAFRPGLGATLAIGTLPERLRPAALPRKDGASPSEGLPWPAGEGDAPDPASGIDTAPGTNAIAKGARHGAPTGVDAGRLNRIVERGFTEPHPKRLRRTRALLVVHDGRIAAERYAPGFGKDTPLPGWSMTKAVTSALVGALVGEGGLSLERSSLLPEWSGPDDPRRRITLDDMLRMRSGLEFAEVYTDPLADVTRMLFACGDAAAFAAAKTLRAPPGASWCYASGTTNIVSRVVREALEGSHEDYLRFPRKALFDRIGMRSAVMEPDAAGHFVGSSFMFATARDWARFGLLYARDGLWDGNRVLPEGWVDYSRKPTPQSPEGCYGAHWWLKLQPELGGGTEDAERIPPDAFFALGHEGQSLTVIPSKKLVAVRLGLSVYLDAWNHAAFLASVLDTLV